MVIKYLVAIVLLVSNLNVVAQSSAVNEMVSAEKAFIEMARNQNRRDAFLQYLSDSAVTQGPNGPRKGKAHIAAQPTGEDLLSWEVAYIDIAESGDFGFNTGPWEYRSRKTDEKPSAYGEFNSVWKKQADGAWKNVLDIGISHGPREDTVVWSSWKQRWTSDCVEHPAQKPFNEEQKFEEGLSKEYRVTYLNSLSTRARMMVSGFLPFKGVEQLSNFIAACPNPSQFLVLGGEMSISRDMAYVYGTATVQLTKDGKPESKKATFVRIWRVEDCNWKIVLDVLTF